MDAGGQYDRSPMPSAALAENITINYFRNTTWTCLLIAVTVEGVVYTSVVLDDIIVVVMLVFVVFLMLRYLQCCEEAYQLMMLLVPKKATRYRHEQAISVTIDYRFLEQTKRMYNQTFTNIQRINH